MMTNRIIITLLLIEIALHLAEIAFDLHAHYGLQELLYGQPTVKIGQKNTPSY